MRRHTITKGGVWPVQDHPTVRDGFRATGTSRTTLHDDSLSDRMTQDAHSCVMRIQPARSADLTDSD
jgi:hypothetical protein